MLRDLTTGIAALPLARLVRGAATLAAGDGSLSVRSSTNTIMLQREPSVEGSLCVHEIVGVCRGCVSGRADASPSPLGWPRLTSSRHSVRQSLKGPGATVTQTPSPPAAIEVRHPPFQRGAVTGIEAAICLLAESQRTTVPIGRS